MARPRRGEVWWCDAAADRPPAGRRARHVTRRFLGCAGRWWHPCTTTSSRLEQRGGARALTRTRVPRISAVNRGLGGERVDRDAGRTHRASQWRPDAPDRRCARRRASIANADAISRSPIGVITARRGSLRSFPVPARGPRDRRSSRLRAGSSTRPGCAGTGLRTPDRGRWPRRVRRQPRSGTPDRPGQRHHVNDRGPGIEDPCAVTTRAGCRKPAS